MLQSLRRFPLAAILVLAVTATACGDDDPADPDDDEARTVTFTYVPAEGGPAITSVAVRGTFNEWGPPLGTDLNMTERADGSWSADIELEPGSYEFKYFFNGATWSQNMCADDTFGNPAGGPVSPQSDVCNTADNNNAMLVVD